MQYNNSTIYLTYFCYCQGMDNFYYHCLGDSIDAKKKTQAIITLLSFLLHSSRKRNTRNINRKKQTQKNCTIKIITDVVATFTEPNITNNIIKQKFIKHRVIECIVHRKSNTKNFQKKMLKLTKLLKITIQFKSSLFI